MQIIIDGKLAALKPGTSFEFVSENFLFSGSDGYSFTISFPLRGCTRNLEIFGHVNRADVISSVVCFDCEIRCVGFHRYGSLTVTEITEAEVKGQFLEGRSAQNFDRSFDKIYINELSLGTGPEIAPNDPAVYPAKAWNPSTYNRKYVALPWVNNAQQGQPHNFAAKPAGVYMWTDSSQPLSWQPFLTYITEQICDAVGYRCDISEWKSNAKLRFLLVCNTLPPAWDMPDFGRVLPRWTVTEYFEKLEQFLMGEFTIDHAAQSVSFRFSSSAIGDAGYCTIDQVVDSFTEEVSAEDAKNEYIGCRRIGYSDRGDRQWKYLSCPWIAKDAELPVKTYTNTAQYISQNKRYSSYTAASPSGSGLNQLHYVIDNDAYYINRIVKRVDAGSGKYTYTAVPQPVNCFGPLMPQGVDEDAAQTLDLDFVPARIEFSEEKYGNVLFLDPGGFSEISTDESLTETSAVEALILSGERQGRAEYYSKIFVGFWDGTFNSNLKLPHPHVAEMEITDDWSLSARGGYSLRLNAKRTVSAGSAIPRATSTIDPKRKFTFSFLSPSLPDVRSRFFIKGKMFVCEKITATFTEAGMSRLLKGVFYQIID